MPAAVYINKLCLPSHITVVVSWCGWVAMGFVCGISCMITDTVVFTPFTSFASGRYWSVIIKKIESEIKFMLKLQIGWLSQNLTYLEFEHDGKLHICQILCALLIQWLKKMPEIEIDHRLKRFYKHRLSSVKIQLKCQQRMLMFLISVWLQASGAKNNQHVFRILQD